MSKPLAPPGQHVVDTGDGLYRANRDWFNFASRVAEGMTQMRASGTTAQRPTKNLYVGLVYFDTTLGLPIWYDGTEWVDATGTSA